MKKKMLRSLGAVTSAMTAVTTMASAEAVQGVVMPIEEAAVEYAKVANVAGEFAFHQDAVTPTDEIFSLFGTVATGMCAKPNFAFENGQEAADYYLNVSGSLKKMKTFTKAEIEGMPSVQREMICSCATGESLAQAMVTGVPVSAILEMADLDEDANVITFRSADGYGEKLPLSYVLEKEALIVYAINGEAVPTQTQVWMPGTVASYFTRQVADIEVSAEESVPEVKQADAAQRVKVTLGNTVSGTVKTGDDLSFTGYADDFGTPIAAIEFSMDGGETWTVCETKEANSEKWICWTFTCKAGEPGAYKMEIRARNVNGETTPLAASVMFTVE